MLRSFLKKTGVSTVVAIVSCGMWLSCGSEAKASLLQIMPTTTPQWTGTTPQNPMADDVESITGFGGELEELYKANVPSDEEGPFAGFYSTLFSNTASDPSDALIEWDGGLFITSPEFLLVKGGAGLDPTWYIFDIGTSGLDWDGQMDIELTGFWPEQGSISHISIFGGEEANVIPEPATVAVWSVLGLVGLLYARTRRSTK